MKKYFAFFLLFLGLASCGFHLRGMTDLPIWLDHVTVISKDGNKELISLLKSQLEGYKIHVDPDPEHAQYWLIINRSFYQQKIISIGASTNPRQYQMILSIEFMLQTRKGKVIKEPSTVTATRQLTVNNNRILGSNDEEDTLLKEMRQDAIIQLINRLSKK